MMKCLATDQHGHRREAAEALKARNIPAQGKHAESVRRPGYNGDYARVPRPLCPQSAKLTGGKGAMELTFLACTVAPLQAAFARMDAFSASAASRLGISWPLARCYMKERLHGKRVNEICERLLMLPAAKPSALPAGVFPPVAIVPAGARLQEILAVA